MNKELKTKTLDFKDCNNETEFYDRIIDALELGIGYCGRNWDAIYDFMCTESTVEKLIIKNISLLPKKFESLLPTLYFVLNKVTEEHSLYGDTFVYEIIEEKNTG